MPRRNAKPPLNWRQWLLVSSSQKSQSGRRRHDVRPTAGTILKRSCVPLQTIAAPLGLRFQGVTAMEWFRRDFRDEKGKAAAILQNLVPKNTRGRACQLWPLTTSIDSVWAFYYMWCRPARSSDATDGISDQTLNKQQRSAQRRRPTNHEPRRKHCKTAARFGVLPPTFSCAFRARVE